MQNGNLITQKQPQLKRTLPKFLLAVLLPFDGVTSSQQECAWKVE